MGLRDLRKASGRKVKEICKEIGISTATWYNWEAAGWDPKNSQMKVVAQVLDLPIEVVSDNLQAPVEWPKKLDHTAYGLALLTLDSSEDLPSGGKALVILVDLKGKYHARIFDRFGVMVISMDLILNQDIINHLESSIVDSEFIVTTICQMVGYEDLGYTRRTLLLDTLTCELLEKCRDRYEQAGWYTNQEIEPRANAIVVEKAIKLLDDELLMMEAC